MKYLLDTCTLIWAMMNSEKLSNKAHAILEESESGDLIVSTVSALEIGQKSQKNKLSLTYSIEEWFEKSNEVLDFQKLPIDFEVGLLSTQLPLIHKDPLDRILVATAQIHKFTLLTPDPFIRQYPNVKVEW